MRLKKSLAAYVPCPCGTDKTYALCCGVWHQGVTQGLYAPTAEALMRSRYSAYVLNTPEYLLATWHGSTTPGALDLPIVKWVDLQVCQAHETGEAGVVEFIACYRLDGVCKRLHEISRFVCQEDRWWYIDGVESVGD